MHILQSGIRKCGNSWLYHILQQIIREAGIPYKSVIQNDPIYPLALDWNLSFEGQAGVDYLELSPNQAAYKIGGIYRMPIGDIDEYIANTTHVWTHSGWRDLAETVFPKFDKIVYIVRDPRDRLISLSHFMFSDYRQEFTPQKAVEFKSAESYLERKFDYEMNWWKNHVTRFLQHYHSNHVHLLFYERMLADFGTELDGLLAYLGIELDEAAKERITKAVAFDTMKANSPGHLRKGQAYKWMEQMSTKHQARALALAGEQIRILGYPEHPGDNPPLPSLDAITKEAVAALQPKKKPLHERAMRKLMKMLD